MNWYQVVLLLVTIVCIAAPMLYVFGIKEKEMHPNVKEMQNVQALRIENAKLRELVNDMWICISHGEGWDCTGCRRDPDSVCIMGISEFSQRMRELRIEVK